MKDPKNTRDYGKFDSPRRMFAKGGRVKREPGLTEHLQTGPSWWPEPLGAWKNPRPVNPAANRQLNDALARDEARRQKRIEASDKPADMAYKAARDLANTPAYFDHSKDDQGSGSGSSGSSGSRRGGGGGGASSGTSSGTVTSTGSADKASSYADISNIGGGGFNPPDEV